MTNAGIIVFPNEFITAQVHTPEALMQKSSLWDNINVHVGSTFARLGVDFFLNRRALSKALSETDFPKTLSLLISNQGRYPFLVREHDIATVADHNRLTLHPQTFSHPKSPSEQQEQNDGIILHIGDEYLEIVEENLPIFPGKGIRYIDPHVHDLYRCTRTRRFDTFPAESGGYFVFATKELVQIPSQTIGVFRDTLTDALQHSSSIFAYPSRDARRFAVEFLVRKQITITPGMPAVSLRLYRASAERRGSPRYTYQSSIIPNGPR